MVIGGNGEGKQFYGVQRVVHPLETVHGDAAVRFGERQQVGVATEAATDTSLGLKDNAVVEVDAVGVGHVKEEAGAAAQYQDNNAECGAVVEGNDLEGRWKVPSQLGKIDHNGGGDWISSRNAVPFHLDQIALVCSEKNTRRKRINTERQSKLLHILDTNRMKRAAWNIGSSIRCSVQFKETLLISHFEYFDDTLTTYNGKVTTVAAPNKHHFPNEVRRTI